MDVDYFTEKSILCNTNMNTEYILRNFLPSADQCQTCAHASVCKWKIKEAESKKKITCLHGLYFLILQKRLWDVVETLLIYRQLKNFHFQPNLTSTPTTFDLHITRTALPWLHEPSHDKVQKQQRPAPSVTLNLVVSMWYFNCMSPQKAAQTCWLLSACLPPSQCHTRLVAAAVCRGATSTLRRNKCTNLGFWMNPNLMQILHTHWVNFGRLEDGVSLMVDQELFFKNIPAQWKRRIAVCFRGTIKPDETAREAAARASSPVQLTVCIPVSFKEAFTMHFPP